MIKPSTITYEVSKSLENTYNPSNNTPQTHLPVQKLHGNVEDGQVEPEHPKNASNQRKGLGDFFQQTTVSKVQLAKSQVGKLEFDEVRLEVVGLGLGIKISSELNNLLVLFYKLVHVYYKGIKNHIKKPR